MDTEQSAALSEAELIAFDLDDTLAASKQPLAADMAEELLELLKQVKVAVVSGASFDQLVSQFLDNLPAADDVLAKLFLVPTNGARLYTYDRGWRSVYEVILTAEDRDRIKQAFENVLSALGEPSAPGQYGEIVEDRKTQITYSGLGADAPIELKAVWDPDKKKRQAIAARLREILPDFAIGLGGMTSIDVTKPGVDKAYGVERLAEHCNIPLAKVVYVGDALYPGGNDSAVNRLGINAIPVDGVGDTKKLIKKIVKIKTSNA